MLKDNIRIYRYISKGPPPPLFQLQVLLSIPELANNQVLVHLAPDSSRRRLDPAPKYIILESWELAFAPRDFEHERDSRYDITPPAMYKHAIPLFRSIFTLLRILPAWKLARRLSGRGGVNGHFSIQLRVQGQGLDDTESIPIDGILDFGESRRAPYINPDILHSADMPPAPGAPLMSTATHSFPAITHPFGTLSLSLTYLTAPNFRLDELESLLSSRFLSDEETDFTPTLVRNQQRESVSGSPGSLPMRTSLPRSPAMSSVAERFVVSPALHTRTTSFPLISGGSPRMQPMVLPLMRAPPPAGPAGSASGMSDASSRQGNASEGSREDSASAYALASRMRRASLNIGRGIVSDFDAHFEFRRFDSISPCRTHRLPPAPSPPGRSLVP